MPGIVPVQRRMPWILGEEDWLRFLRVAGQLITATNYWQPAPNSSSQ